MATNPIIPGFSPDPSIVKVGKWYYLVASTFHLFPGLPIYVSENLVSWRQIGNAIHRQSQLSLRQSDTNINELKKINDVMLSTGGLYAPTIRYNDGVFYVVCTNVVHKDGKDSAQNFIVSTKDIWAGEWSDLTYFEFRGIDPSLLFDDDGKVYVHGSLGPGPMTKIANFEINLQTGEKLSEQQVIWEGTGGIYPEGPHVYKRNGWYYLMISEGGTHENHMITMARSKSIWGPFEPCPHNPILTARGTDEYISFTGHCDAFQDENEQWWGVCLGVRKDPDGRYIMGRETFLTRGEWDSDWLKFETVKTQITGVTQNPVPTSLTADPKVDLLYIRDAEFSNYHFTDEASIRLTATSIDLSHSEMSPTFVCKRQRSLNGATTATLNIKSDEWSSSTVKAGIAVYKDEHRYARIFYDSSHESVTFEVINNAKKIYRLERKQLNGLQGRLSFKIAYTEQEYRFQYATNNGTLGAKYIQIAAIDTLELTGRDFVGPVCGIFAISDTQGPDVEFYDLVVE